MTKVKGAFARPTRGGNQAGVTLVELLISTGIISIAAYFAASAVSNSMAAKKDVQISNFASQFEEPLRTSASTIQFNQAENACFGSLQTSPLFNQLASAEWQMNQFTAPYPLPDGIPESWKDAFARCNRRFRYNSAEQTIYSCITISPTASTRDRKHFGSGDFAFAEVSFALVNLRTMNGFRTCTPARGNQKAGSPAATRTINATEFTGNADRGFRMTYTIYASLQGGEGKRRFDSITGQMVAGANIRPQYCVTREGGSAKGPGVSGGVNACDYVPNDMEAVAFKTTTLEIPKEALDAFYPPPPDPCEKKPKPKDCDPPDQATGDGDTTSTHTSTGTSTSTKGKP